MENLRSRTSRIVIIDDDDAGRDSLQFALAAEGYQTEAWTGNMIPDSTSFHHVSCIVVEQALESTTGMGYILDLRRQGFSRPIILTVFEPSSQMRVAASRAGATLLERPFQVADLIYCIEALAN
jgi:FixJ family two-component response regulator